MATLTYLILELARSLFNDEDGQDQIEFGLIVSIISLAALVSLHVMHGSLAGMWRDLALLVATIHF